MGALWAAALSLVQEVLPLGCQWMVELCHDLLFLAATLIFHPAAFHHYICPWLLLFTSILKSFLLCLCHNLCTYAISTSTSSLCFLYSVHGETICWVLHAFGGCRSPSIAQQSLLAVLALYHALCNHLHPWTCGWCLGFVSAQEVGQIAWMEFDLSCYWAALLLLTALVSYWIQVWSNETALVARCRRVYANAHAYHINSVSNNRWVQTCIFQVVGLHAYLRLVDLQYNLVWQSGVGLSVM